MLKVVRESRRRATAVLIVATLSMVAASIGVPTSSGASASPATTLAHRLLDEAVIPNDAVLSHPATAVLCQCAGVPAAGAITTRHQYFVVPGSPGALESFLTRHLPVGGHFDGSSQTSSSSNGAEIISVVISFPANGPHVYLRQLAYSMTARTSSTSWLRVDSQVDWIPSRHSSQFVTAAVSATVTGFKSAGLSGSSGDVRVHVVGKRLATLLASLNALPLGPTQGCMESLNGFEMTITLASGARLAVTNGFCAGAFDAVYSLSPHSNGARYILADNDCALLKDVASLFVASSVPGTSEALHSCESWLKANAS